MRPNLDDPNGKLDPVPIGDGDPHNDADYQKDDEENEEDEEAAEEAVADAADDLSRLLARHQEDGVRSAFENDRYAGPDDFHRYQQ